MAQVEVGQTISFEIKAFNKDGKEVPLKDPAAVTITDGSIAAATVQNNGKNGRLTGLLEGQTNLNASSGQLTDQEQIVVVPDMTPVLIEVVFGQPIP